MPDIHDKIDGGGEHERNIAAVHDLQAVRQEERGVDARNTPATARLTGRLHFQISRMAMSSSAEVSSIVDDTAMP